MDNESRNFNNKDENSHEEDSVNNPNLPNERFPALPERRVIRHGQPRGIQPPNFADRELKVFDLITLRNTPGIQRVLNLSNDTPVRHDLGSSVISADDEPIDDSPWLNEEHAESAETDGTEAFGPVTHLSDDEAQQEEQAVIDFDEFDDNFFPILQSEIPEEQREDVQRIMGGGVKPKPSDPPSIEDAHSEDTDA